MANGLEQTGAGVLASAPVVASYVTPERDPACTRCPLHQYARTVCMAGDGPSGGVLVVAKGPGRDEDQKGCPQQGVTGQYLRRLVGSITKAPVRFTNATRCFAGTLDPTKVGAVEACHLYLLAEIRKHRPTHILALGAEAIAALAGEFGLGVSTVRGGGTVVEGVPVTFLPHVAAATRERGAGLRRFISEFQRVLKEPPAVVAWTPTRQTRIRFLTTEQACVAAFRQAESKLCAWDSETYGKLHSPAMELLCVAVAESPDEAFVAAAPLLQRPAVTAAFRRWAGSHGGKLGSNAKFDMHAARAVGIDIRAWRAVEGDTAVWRRLVDSESRRNLAELSWLVGMGGYKRESMKAVKETGLPEEEAYAAIDPRVMKNRCAWDAMATFRLAKLMESEVSASFSTAWDALLRPAIPTYAAMEAFGVRVDAEKLQRIASKIDERVDGLKHKLAVYPEVQAFVDARGEVNLNSAEQLRVLLYDRMKLPILGRTEKTKKPSTDKASLDGLRHVHPLVDDILRFRWLVKKREEAGEKLLKHIRPDGRIHTTLNLDGAGTGRQSSEKPNLQNISHAEEAADDPDDAIGQMIRSCFLPEPGCVFLQLDYKMLELCVAAFLSGDPTLMGLLSAGADVHRETAAVIHGKPADEVTKEERRAAKSTVFRILFGDREYGVSKALGISEQEAARHIARIFGRYPRLGRFMRNQVVEAMKTGEVWTWWAGERCQRRYIPDIASPIRSLQRHAERAAQNTPVQGTAAYFTMATANELDRLKVEEGRPYSVHWPVHDSLLLSVPRRDLADVARAVVEVSTGWDARGLKLRVDLEVGDTWGTMKPYTLSD